MIMHMIDIYGKASQDFLQSLFGWISFEFHVSRFDDMNIKMFHDFCFWN